MYEWSVLLAFPQSFRRCFKYSGNMIRCHMNTSVCGRKRREFAFVSGFGLPSVWVHFQTQSYTGVCHNKLHKWYFQNLKITFWTLNYIFQASIIYIHIRKLKFNATFGFPFPVNFQNFASYFILIYILCSDLYILTSYIIKFYRQKKQYIVFVNLNLFYYI